MTGSGLLRRGGARWPAVAAAVAQLAEQALADPNHPWTLRWPTSVEMAAMFGTTQTVILTALNYLHDEGVLVKAWVPRPDGPRELWVPTARGLGFGSRPTVEQITAEIVKRGVGGEWAVLPSQYTLAAHFRTSTRTIDRVKELLVARRQAIKVRNADGAGYRWRIVAPHELRTIDPRLTVPAPRVVVVDLIRRIRAGEFRYRLPDGTVHERPFLANTELTEQYRIGPRTVDKAKKELLRLGWIVPGERPNARCRLAERVPPVDRSNHPAARKSQIQPSRARELADDLIARIMAGEFNDRPFVGLVEAMTEYRANRFNMRAAFDELEREGWIEFRHSGWGRVAVLADPLPEQPDTMKPLPRPSFKSVSKRARELADDLIARIMACEFNNHPFPGLRDVMTTYNASQVNAQAAFDELEREGWIEFQRNRRGRFAVLADPLPEQPDTRLAIRVENLGLTMWTLNCLRREGITTVREIVARSDHELLAIRNLGVKSLGEAKRTLAALGFVAEPPADQAQAG